MYSLRQLKEIDSVKNLITDVYDIVNKFDYTNKRNASNYNKKLEYHFAKKYNTEKYSLELEYAAFNYDDISLLVKNKNPANEKYVFSFNYNIKKKELKLQKYEHICQNNTHIKYQLFDDKTSIVINKRNNYELKFNQQELVSIENKDSLNMSKYGLTTPDNIPEVADIDRLFNKNNKDFYSVIVSRIFSGEDFSNDEKDLFLLHNEIDLKKDTGYKLLLDNAFKLPNDLEKNITPINKLTKI